jgi:hypothetical protein
MRGKHKLLFGVMPSAGNARPRALSVSPSAVNCFMNAFVTTNVHPITWVKPILSRQGGVVLVYRIFSEHPEMQGASTGWPFLEAC